MKKWKLLGCMGGALFVGFIGGGWVGAWWSARILGRMQFAHPEMEMAQRAAQEATWLNDVRQYEPGVVIKEMEHTLDMDVGAIESWDRIAPADENTRKARDRWLVTVKHYREKYPSGGSGSSRSNASSVIDLGGNQSDAIARSELPSCDALLAAAKTKAANEHKAIYVHYGASWCAPCKALDSFLEDGKVRPVFEKYFVLLKLVMKQNEKDPALGNAGAEEFYHTLSPGAGGLPFQAFVGVDEKLIVNCNRPADKNTPRIYAAGVNIGFPSEPQDIAWFIQMIKKAAPNITEADVNTIESALRNWKTEN